MNQSRNKPLFGPTVLIRLSFPLPYSTVLQHPRPPWWIAPILLC